MFINISRVLWGFNLRKKQGPDGKEIDVTEKMAPGFFSVPEPFECDITPRSEERARIMRDASRDAERDWEGKL